MTEAAPPTWSGPNLTGKLQRNRLAELRRRVMSVTRIEDLNPRYRRVYLTAEDLADGFPFMPMAVTDHVKVMFPQPDTGEVIMPVRTPEGFRVPEGSPPPISRDYTVRGWDPQRGELVLDFVIHGTGIASDWGRNARPGDQLGIMGPRGNVVLPENYSWYLFAGDETAVPTLGRLLEELPEGVAVHAVVLIEDESARQPELGRPGARVDWLVQQGSGSLLSAVRAVPTPADDDWYVLAAGEVGELKPLRDYVRQELGLPRERVMVSGYWQRGIVNLDHHNTGLEE